MSATAAGRRWVTRGVVGIVLATFFSDVGHEMVTAILPIYLATAGLGPAALGAIEGVADLLFSLSKLAGGVVGHHVTRKRPLAAAGYGLTAVATGALGLVQSAVGFVGLRGAAWAGRGFRSPLRDYLLADEVAPERFGRAYGIERTADMLGAVAGPLLAVGLVAAAVPLRSIVLLSVIPAAVSVVAILAMTRDRTDVLAAPGTLARQTSAARRLPRAFWWFLVGVLLFGLGDFSRTFLVLLGTRAFGDGSGHAVVTSAVLLYAIHNAVSAVAAYPLGHLGDRRPRMVVLAAGYALGVATNLLLAGGSGSAAALVAATVLSGIYIAAEETLEKAIAAELLPREVRSLGFGILAAANALGDMVSSLYVGALLQAGRPGLAFGIAAGFGAAGAAWTFVVARARRALPSQ